MLIDNKCYKNLKIENLLLRCKHLTRYNRDVYVTKVSLRMTGFARPAVVFIDATVTKIDESIRS